jgi:hypothetical protein
MGIAAIAVQGMGKEAVLPVGPEHIVEAPGDLRRVRVDEYAMAFLPGLFGQSARGAKPFTLSRGL